jgi:hypothetical protein
MAQTDGAKEWINALACYSAAINQSGHIFVTIENRRMQRTTDNGNSWQELQNGVSGKLMEEWHAHRTTIYCSGDSEHFALLTTVTTGQKFLAASYLLMILFSNKTDKYFHAVLTRDLEFGHQLIMV